MRKACSGSSNLSELGTACLANADCDPDGVCGSTVWVEASYRLGIPRRILEGTDLANMTPIDGSGTQYDIATVGANPGGDSNADKQVLASPGRTYVAYFWGTPDSEATALTVPAGNYGWAYYDTRRTLPLTSGSFTSTGTSVNVPPFCAGSHAR